MQSRLYVRPVLPILASASLRIPVQNADAALATIWHYDCECELVSQRWWVGEPKNMRTSYASNPALFVRKACGENGRAVDVQRLVALTSFLAEQPGVRTVSLVEKLVRLVLDSSPIAASARAVDPTTERSCLWERPLLGIANVLLVAKKSGFGGSEDAAMKEEVRKSYKAILRVLRNDLLKFLSATQHADHLRYSVLKFLTAAGEGYGLDM